MESERLIAQSVRANLDICLTIAAFSDAKPSSQELKTACQRAAARGMHVVERLIRREPENRRPNVHNELESLRAYVSGAAAESAEPAKPACKPASRGAAAETLTPRELEVLRYIAEGHSTKKVAEILGITFKTAACHRYRVMEKLGIHETANLVRYAIRNGMVQA